MKRSILQAYDQGSESLTNADLLRILYDKILYAIDKIEDTQYDDVRVKNTQFVLSALDLLISSLDTRKVKTGIYNAYLSFYISSRKSIMHNLVNKDTSEFQDIKKGINIMIDNI